MAPKSHKQQHLTDLPRLQNANNVLYTAAVDGYDDDGGSGGGSGRGGGGMDFDSRKKDDNDD